MAKTENKQMKLAKNEEISQRTARLASRFGGGTDHAHGMGERKKGSMRGGSGGPMHQGMMATGKPKNAGKVIGRLFSYLKGDGWRLALVMLAMLLNTGSMLAGSYLMRPIINDLTTFASPESAVVNLIKGLSVLAVVYLVGVVCSYFQQWWMVRISQKALTTLRGQLFSKLQRLPVSYYDSQSAGDLMSRFTNDVDTIGNMLNSTIVQVISGIVTLIGTFVMMVVTNIWLTIITVLFVPLIALAGQMIAKKSRRYFTAQQEALGAMNGYTEEMVSGQKVVKVFGHEGECKEEFALLNGDLEKKQLFANFFGGIMGPVMGNMSQINYAITACVGGILCVTSGFDVGGLTVFANYSRQFSRPINEVAMQVNVIFSALAGAERVFAVLDEPEPDTEGETVCLDGSTLKGGVALSHVNFGYLPDKQVLKDVTLWAKPGQKIAFVGSTGAGKTTITNLLNRFYEIWSGEITIDGTPIREITKDSLRTNIAMVLQDTHLFTGTVMENIRYGRLDATDDEVIAAAKAAHAHSFIKHLPEGYQTMLDGDGANLSQGQRQLLNIARAAISKAPILILDEATSSVDTRTEKQIEKGMDTLMMGRTTFVIAHRLSTVRNANAIMVLEHGEIIERGSHEDLLDAKGRYYSLYTGREELS